MAESSVYFTWGAPVTGRENKGLEVFQEALAFWEKRKNAGEIEDYRVGICESGDLSRSAGYLIAEGTEESLSRIMRSEDHRRMVMRASHIVEHLTMCQCATGTAIPGRIERLMAVRKEMGI